MTTALERIASHRTPAHSAPTRMRCARPGCCSTRDKASRWARPVLDYDNPGTGRGGIAPVRATDLCERGSLTPM